MNGQKIEKNSIFFWKFAQNVFQNRVNLCTKNSCLQQKYSKIEFLLCLKFFFRLALTGSLLALGALFGSLSAVYLMDAVGRKASLLAFSVMSLFIGWTLLMAASQVWQLYTGRFLLGLGAGMEITICPVYIHEICRPALRDVCGSFPQVIWNSNRSVCDLETIPIFHPP